MRLTYILCLCIVLHVTSARGGNRLSETVKKVRDTLNKVKRADDDKVQDFQRWKQIQDSQKSPGTKSEPDEEEDKTENNNLDSDTVDEILMDRPHGEMNTKKVEQSATRREVSYISRPDNIVTVTREITSDTRRKRLVYILDTPWQHRIPVVFDATYIANGQSFVDMVRRVLKEISRHLCVTFDDVTDTYDPSNPTLFTENGYETNAYMLMKEGSGCAAPVGPGNGTAARGINVCHHFEIATHEILHSLGVQHDHQSPNRNNYLTILPDNIIPESMGSYALMDPPSQFLNFGFDSHSAVLYAQWAFNKNKMETYQPIRGDFFQGMYAYSGNLAIYKELNQLYKCNEVFCDNAETDCGPGYYTHHKGVCQCVCPPELDPATNCQTLVNSGQSQPWPDTPAVLLAGGPDNSCPTGFNTQPGWVSFTGQYATLQLDSPAPMPNLDKTMYMPCYVKDAPASYDREDWPPGGRYCIFKPQGHDCGGAFLDYTLEFKSWAPVQTNGSYGDLTVDGDLIKMRLCCKKTEDREWPLDLPNDKPFRFLAKGDCPHIRGKFK